MNCIFLHSKQCKKDDRERKQRSKQLQNAIEKENIIKEQGWMGRSGGLDISLNIRMESEKKRNKDQNEEKKQVVSTKACKSGRPSSAGKLLPLDESRDDLGSTI